MPRFTEDEMKKAVLKVTDNGWRVNRVAKENGLCKKTLKSYVDKYLNNFGNNGATISFRPNYEINQVFTHQLEQVFEEHLISLDCAARRKMTRDFVREEAYNFATMCNVHVPKTWNVRKQAGLDWMYGFLNRHPKIKSIIVRNKKNVQSSRLEMVNREIIDEKDVILLVDTCMKNDDSSSDNELIGEENHRANECAMQDDVLQDDYSYRIQIKSPLDEFLENIRLAYEVVAEEDFVKAEQVYNLGEIALVVDDSLSRNGEQLLVTACCFFNAAGHCLPPFFIFPWKEWHSSVIEGLPEGTAGTVRSTGRLDDEAFSLVLEHFQRQIQTTPTNKIVLIMDVDEHHITINSLDFFQKYGIEVVTLPPHYGSNLQPAERYVFPTIRSLFNQCLLQYHARRQAHLTAKHIAVLFCRIKKIAFTSDNIRKGFFESGIFPFNDVSIVNEFLSPQKINHYEPTVRLTDISLDFPDALNEDETVLVDERASPLPYSPLAKNVFFGGTPVEEFFNNLVQAYRELEAHEGVKPEKIYNVDEFEISINVLESNRPPSHISVCYYANAIGHALPPYLVYPETEFSPTMLAGGVEGTSGTSSTDGRVDKVIFLRMFQHFQRHVNASLSNRVIVIMDCETYHISLESIEFCELNGITLVTVPPHITGIFQPLERTVFQTLFSSLQGQFMGTQSETAVSMSDVAGLLAKTFESCCTTESIASGFKMSGIWPLDHDLIISHGYWTECFDEADGTDGGNVLSEDSKTDEEDDSIYSDPGSDFGSSISDCEVDLFYNKIDDFLREEEHSSNERLYVLGELRLTTCSVVANVKLFVNAIGTLLSPYLIYSTDADDAVLESSLGVTCYRCEKNVSDDEHTLLMSVKHFREHSLVSKDHKMLLLFEDANRSRLTQTVREFGENNGIVYAAVPGIHSECLHPLENTFLRMLRQRFEETQYQLDSINDVIGFLEQACIELFKSEEIVTKFEEYGICSMRSSNGSILADGEEEDELSFVNLDVYSNANLKDYDDFIIEEEIEVSVDEEGSEFS